MADTNIPNAIEKIDARDTNVPWFIKDIGDKLGPSAREVLENYSKIPAKDVEAHVYKIRDDAWQIWPYPCIGGFRFLDLAISHSPFYPEVLQRLKSGNEIFLDLGCCFGQEMRRLVYDGVPVSSIYGSDLRPDFFELGFELFKDRETFTSKFIAADVFDPSSALKELDGKVDVIYAGSFLHLFGYAQQVEVCQRIVKLLRPTPGSVLLGRQVGDAVSGERPHRTNQQQTMFRHNQESFEQMWKEVGDLTGTKWRVEAELKVLDEFERQSRADWQDTGVRRIGFSVFRL